MNTLKFYSIYIFVFLAAAALTVAQVPLFPFPPDDGTESYYVAGENGVNIFVEEKGDPKKSTILFSSGFSTSRISWDPIWYDPNFFKNFHLVRYDYRGIGNSDKPTAEGSYSLDLNGADLAAVITNFTSKYDYYKKKIVLVGWSIGAPVSLTFMKNHPNIKIDAFVSVCGIVNETYTVPNPPFAPYVEAISDPKENYTAVINALDSIYKYYVSFKPFSDEVHSMFLGIAVKAPFQYRRWGAQISFSLAEYYSTLDMPTLHFIGEKDLIVSLDHSLYFASLGKNSKSIIYKDIGHAPPWEDIKTFNKDLRKFVSEV